MQLKYYTQIGMLFLGCYLTANVVGPKPVALGGIIVPAGLMVFPMTYLLGALLTEVYGFSLSRRVIWMSLLCNLMLSAVCQIAVHAPCADDWPNQQAYALILSNSSRLMVISVATYFVGELLNALVVAKLKVKMAGKNFWLRGICGNWLGEGVETLLFIPLAFWQLPREQLINMCVYFFSIKITYAFCAMPIMHWLAKVLKQAENTDAYDNKFNPEISSVKGILGSPALSA